MDLDRKGYTAKIARGTVCRTMNDCLINLLKHHNLLRYKESFEELNWCSIVDLSYIEEKECEEVSKRIGINDNIDKYQFKLLIRKVLQLYDNENNVNNIKKEETEELIVKTNINQNGTINFIDLSSPTPPQSNGTHNDDNQYVYIYIYNLYMMMSLC